MDKNVTGNFIAELRKEKGMTQSELAKQLSVSDKAVSRWETGKGLPDLTSLMSLGSIFSLTVDELLCGKRAEKNKTDTGEKEIVYVELPKKKIKPMKVLKRIAEIILVYVILINILYMYRYGELKTFGSFPYGYTTISAVSNTIELYDLKFEVAADGGNKTTMSKKGNGVFVWTKYGGYSGTLSFKNNNRAIVVPFEFVNTNNWYKNSIIITVDIVGDDVTITMSGSSAELDRTIYAETNMVKCKVDDIKSIYLMK